MAQKLFFKISKYFLTNKNIQFSASSVSAHITREQVCESRRSGRVANRLLLYSNFELHSLCSVVSLNKYLFSESVSTYIGWARQGQAKLLEMNLFRWAMKFNFLALADVSLNSFCAENIFALLNDLLAIVT